MVNSRSHLVDAAVLSGSACRVPGSMNAGDRNARHAHLGTTGYEWLSRDPEIVRAFVDDPLTFPAKVLPLFGVADGMRLYGVPRRIDPPIPLLIAGGSDDSLGGTRSMRRLAQAYRRRGGLDDVTLSIYPGARHEIFNEINRATVLDDLVRWLDERLFAARVETQEP